VSPETAFELVAEILARHCSVDASFITADLRLREDLGLDSVDAADLLVTLQERTGRTVELEHVEDIETVASVVEQLVEAVPTRPEHVGGVV
jgi:acyl carrier protein